MSPKSDKDKAKQLQDKCQSVLNALLRDEDNKYCVDCDSKAPRWASWNLGVFLCIRCAGIHRNLGVHISKVKSVNLDSWTGEQVVSLQQMGNSRARAVYEANLPDNFRRPHADHALESFIRAKYEHKRYIAREWVPPKLPQVNWEKEIDEEIEKQSRKSRTVSENKSLPNVEVPQIPKPNTPTPKPNTVKLNKPSKNEEDLLGLQNTEDLNNLLSAPLNNDKKQPVTTEKPDNKNTNTTNNTDIQLEEKNFFNQKTPTEQEKIKLTKDSILSLYGQNSTTVNRMPMRPQMEPHNMVHANVGQVQMTMPPNMVPNGRFGMQGPNFGMMQNMPMQGNQLHNGFPGQNVVMQPQNGGFPGQNTVQNMGGFNNQQFGAIPNQFAMGQNQQNSIIGQTNLAQFQTTATPSLQQQNMFQNGGFQPFMNVQTMPQQGQFFPTSNSGPYNPQTLLQQDFSGLSLSGTSGAINQQTSAAKSSTIWP